jgi:hypothetical protein
MCVSSLLGDLMVLSRNSCRPLILGSCVLWQRMLLALQAIEVLAVRASWNRIVVPE